MNSPPSASSSTFSSPRSDRHRIGILHYDNEFEVILAKTDLEFAGVWLAPHGEL